MIDRVVFIIICFFTINFYYGQNDNIISEIISDCEGATNILEPGDYSLQFTGNGGLYNDVIEYPSLNSISEKNSLWLTFIAPFDGFINLKASVSYGGIQMVIFQNEIGDLCPEIHNGGAEIKRLFLDISHKELALNSSPINNQNYSLELKEGEKIAILFNTIDKSREVLHLKFDFEPKDMNSLKVKSQSKIVDLREDEFTPSFRVLVRDAVTGLPVKAFLSIEGSKSLSGLYVGSDFYFVVTRMSNILMCVDSKGYFFEDKEVRVQSNSNQELTFWLEPLAQGKSLQLEEIEFHPGSSNFMPSSYPKLKRLKDFMALNSEVRIEIQGHVFSLDGYSLVGQLLSEARAKRVYNYLVENGISKNRMTTVGMGSKYPIYPNPKFSYEEQMNRRVEIKILE
jgi:outer membrane protein OmpA-like peptidoglycan-associated protein